MLPLWYSSPLPSKYENKVACYTKVFIITNIELKEQYETIQDAHRETWDAFIRHIHHVKKYTKDGILQGSVEQYFENRLYNIDVSFFDRSVLCNKKLPRSLY